MGLIASVPGLCILYTFIVGGGARCQNLGHHKQCGILSYASFSNVLILSICW